MSMDPFGGKLSLLFNVFPFLFIIAFVVIIGSIVYGLFRKARNASAPQETSYARIVTKRTEVRSHINHNHHHHHNHAGVSSSSRTYYYITLEFDNGARREYLDVKGLYGLVVEGDTGYAATQGEWIVAFERSNGNPNV